jgi:ABC-2 type transport system permease protein
VTSGVRATLALAGRSAVSVARQPQLVMPSFLFPLFLVAVNTAALGRATSLPAFPDVDSMLDFLVATVIVQGTLFGAIGSGADLAQDIETGFFDRLVAAPVPRLSILLGRMGGAVVLGAAQVIGFVVVLVAFGAEVKGGLAGFAVLVVLGMMMATGIGGLAMAMALRTGSSEAVQGAFPLFFVLLFTSSAFFPRELMRGWYGAVADVNPMSYLIEGARRLVTDGWSVGDAAQTLGVAGAIIVISFALASSALRWRVRGET